MNRTTEELDQLIKTLEINVNSTYYSIQCYGSIGDKKWLKLLFEEVEWYEQLLAGSQNLKYQGKTQSGIVDVERVDSKFIEIHESMCKYSDLIRLYKCDNKFYIKKSR